MRPYRDSVPGSPPDRLHVGWTGGWRRGQGRAETEETVVTEFGHGADGDAIQVVPVVVISQSFPARPSFIP